MQVGLVECALAGLVDDGFAVDRGELRDDVVPGLAMIKAQGGIFGWVSSSQSVLGVLGT